MNVELDKARISAPIAALAAAGLMIGGWIARSEMAQATRETRLAAIDNPRAERQLFNIAMDRPVDYG